MDTKLLCFFLAIVVNQAYAAGSYQDSYKACLKEYNLEKDDALTGFLKNGKFASDDETSKLKCFFHCLSNKVGTSDAAGNMIYESIKNLSVQYPSESELQLFSSEQVKKACIDKQPAKYNEATTPCDKVYAFTLCGLEAVAQQPS